MEQLDLEEKQDKLVEVWSFLPTFETYFKSLSQADKRTLAQLLSNESSYMKSLSERHINLLMDRLGVDEPSKILFKVCESFINDYLPNLNVRSYEKRGDSLRLANNIEYTPQVSPIRVTEKLKDFINNQKRNLLVDEDTYSEEKDFYFFIQVPFMIYTGEVRNWYDGEFPFLAISITLFNIGLLIFILPNILCGVIPCVRYCFNIIIGFIIVSPFYLLCHQQYLLIFFLIS